MSMLINTFRTKIQNVIEYEDSVFFGGPMAEQMFDIALEYRRLGLFKEVLRNAIIDVTFEYDRDTEAYQLLHELHAVIEAKMPS